MTCIIVNWTLGKKIQQNCIQNSNIIIKENAFKNIVCKMSAIFSRPQYVNKQLKKRSIICYNRCYQPFGLLFSRLWEANELIKCTKVSHVLQATWTDQSQPVSVDLLDVGHAEQVVILQSDKQRVLMHGHQGWNVRHGLCHIYMIYVYTVETLYNTVNFCWNTHKRHSIARPKGRGMGCLLWVQRATYCVDLSKLSSIKYLLE